MKNTIVPRIAICNASSRQVACPSPDGRHLELTREIERRGYAYSHTTPLYMAGNRGESPHDFSHCFRHVSGHTVIVYHASGVWKTSCGTGTGRDWQCSGLPSLKAHLESKAKRYGLTTTTTSPIADAVAHLDPKAILCELPDDLFEPGRAVSDAIRAAGYDESATTVVNNLHAWRMTLADFIELISGTEDGY